MAQIPKRRDESIDLFASVVQRQRCAERALHSESAQDRLRAVMAAAHSDALAVKVVANFLCAKAIHHERQHACFFLRRADEVQGGNAQQRSRSIGQQSVFMARDIGNANPNKRS